MVDLEGGNLSNSDPEGTAAYQHLHVPLPALPYFSSKVTILPIYSAGYLSRTIQLKYLSHDIDTGAPSGSGVAMTRLLTPVVPNWP